VFATVSKNYSTSIFRVCVKRMECSKEIQTGDHSKKDEEKKEDSSPYL